MDLTALTYRSEEPSVVPSPLHQPVGYGVVEAAGLVFAFGRYPTQVKTEPRIADYDHRHDGLDCDPEKDAERDNSKVET